MFDILVIPKYHPSCLNQLTFKGSILSLIKLLIIFCAIFMPLNGHNKLVKHINQSIQMLFGK